MKQEHGVFSWALSPDCPTVLNGVAKPASALPADAVFLARRAKGARYCVRGGHAGVRLLCAVVDTYVTDEETEAQRRGRGAALHIPVT